MKLIFYIAVPALGIWTLVEFILYVAHLNPFNWWSLWALIVDLVIAVCMAIDSARNSRIHQENIERMKNPALRPRKEN